MRFTANTSQLMLAFAAGFIAVLVFHQGAWAALHAAGLVPAGQHAWSLTPMPPFHVPAVLSLAFWGGVWAVVLFLALPDLEGPAYWGQWILTGAILLTLVALLVVAPLKGQAFATIPWSRFWIGALVNGAWGLGTAAMLQVFNVAGHRATLR